MLKLTYITYQVFPNEKANTIQTIRMLESLCSLGINAQLIFPDRGYVRNDNEAIIEFYEIKEKFKISPLDFFDEMNVEQGLNDREIEKAIAFIDHQQLRYFWI